MNTKTKSFKDSLKELAPTYITLFVFCYMLFIFEPISTYAQNIHDFWCDIKMLVPLVLEMFGIFFIGSAAFFTIVYLICRKLGKSIPYKILTAVVITLFFPLYMQNTFFNVSLPILDGSPIKWDEIQQIDVYWLLFAICIALISICLIIKLGFDKMLKYASFVLLAVFIMLTSSLVVTITENGALRFRNNIITTNENFNTMSSEKNFVIFVADTVDSQCFEDVLHEDQKYADVFNDFTYYPDTVSVYPFTPYSIPTILSGIITKNEVPIDEYCNKAYNNSPFFSELDERGYDINLYEEFFVWTGNREFDVKNGKSIYDYQIKIDKFLNNELKYIWFKFTPYILKKLVDINEVDFKFGVNMDNDLFSWKNPSFYQTVRENPEIEKQNRNTFQFIHTEGAHFPFVYDENVNKVYGGTSYPDMVKATITTIKAYIDRLKANGLYDNTVIVIMADHGIARDGNDGAIARLNPILLIKGQNEKHELIRSDLPLIQTDLIDAYSQLLDGKQSTELFANIEKMRTRTVLSHDDAFYITEYTVEGKATEYNKFKPTGNEYPYNY